MLSFSSDKRSLLFSRMKKGSIALLFSNPSNFSIDLKFKLNKNFYYLTGIEDDNVVLLLVKSQYGHEESFLFLKSNDVLKNKWDGETLTFKKASELSSIPLLNCLDINNLDSFLVRLLNTSRISKYGFIENFYLDLSKESLNEFSNLSLIKANWLSKNYPYIKIYDLCSFLIDMRIIKDEREIYLIKKAIEVQTEALKEITQIVKPGIYEYQLSAYYNYFLAQRNLRSSFNNIIASGRNATILHYNKQQDKIKANDLILLDLGVNYNNYASDISICLPGSGKFTSQQKVIYNIVLDTNRKIIEWIKPGYTFADMNAYGKDILTKFLQEHNLLKENDKIEKYCYHGLGHYLGLDVHDVGNMNEPIPHNSVITIEPGLYFEEFNLGIRIEDDILIRDDGNINLTEHIPRKIEDIEFLMIKK
ncbi:aminopeptidase P N-terminal domain-containing protein [Columbia Basin potato purple top phytoplasma]|uniref:Xaa-Pro aminopeptidase n=1 Tax=Columbia Basin potato purple top phytoplasma TaxID=307134 RepID=A0ABT5LBR9_9MOLU|nr:aminopeptidase P N-terminal domain-containing protein [Columbia Basin potato purple top phytoplasma]MDC9032102.1 Xaa-Pro aminopeptidase [Columbia Basin potato purple top phytoplasma]